MLSRQEVQAMYQSGARYYDSSQLLYRLIGLRLETYRSRAVELLHLEKGDTAVELGCGTGLNFSLLIEQIGSEGRLIGVDMTPGMLAGARKRVEGAGWTNVELVQSDIATYNLPERVHGILSTGVFGYLADSDRVIEAASQALVPGGRLVILDGKQPERLPSQLFKTVLWLARPFGVTRDYFDRHTWESVQRHFQKFGLEQMYGGMIYIASGTAPQPKPTATRHASAGVSDSA